MLNSTYDITYTNQDWFLLKDNYANNKEGIIDEKSFILSSRLTLQFTLLIRVIIDLLKSFWLPIRSLPSVSDLCVSPIFKTTNLQRVPGAFIYIYHRKQETTGAFNRLKPLATYEKYSRMAINRFSFRLSIRISESFSLFFFFLFFSYSLSLSLTHSSTKHANMCTSCCARDIDSMDAESENTLWKKREREKKIQSMWKKRGSRCIWKLKIYLKSL